MRSERSKKEEASKEAAEEDILKLVAEVKDEVKSNHSHHTEEKHVFSNAHEAGPANASQGDTSTHSLPKGDENKKGTTGSNSSSDQTSIREGSGNAVGEAAPPANDDRAREQVGSSSSSRGNGGDGSGESQKPGRRRLGRRLQTHCN